MMTDVTEAANPRNSPPTLPSEMTTENLGVLGAQAARLEPAAASIPARGPDRSILLLEVLRLADGTPDTRDNTIARATAYLKWIEDNG